MKKSSSFDELPPKKSPSASKTTEDEEMWKLMLQKEQSRYIQRNYKQNSIGAYGEKVVVDKCLKVFNGGSVGGGEIFINGNFNILNFGFKTYFSVLTN